MASTLQVTARLRFYDNLPKKEGRFDGARQLSHLLRHTGVGFRARAYGGCVLVYGPLDQTERKTVESLAARSMTDLTWLD